MTNTHSTLTGLFTDIADSIRTKTGDAGTIVADKFPDAIAAIDTQENLDAELTTQDSLIDQIVTALEGKAGGGTEMEDALVTKNVRGEYSNDRVTIIGSYAFNGCSSLTSVSIPAAETIGDYAFSGCLSLTSASFPVATTISSYAFTGCLSLTSVSFPMAKTIGNGAFHNCVALTSVSFPVATTIGNSAFTYCSTLTTVSCPIVTTIGNSAFTYCSALTTVSFPGVLTIASGAFISCYALTAVSLPNVKTIGSTAFRGCSKLSQLFLPGSSVATLSSTAAFRDTPMSTSTTIGQFGSIYVPASLYDAYCAAKNWSTYSARLVSITE